MTASAPSASPAPARLWRWWIREISAALGARPAAPKPPARRVRIVDGEAIVSGPDGTERKRVTLLPTGGETEIAPPGRLALVIPAEEVLRRSLVVPRRAEPDLEKVVNFEFDAHIPLRRAEVYVAHRIAERGPEGLKLEIFALRKARVDQDRRALSRVGLSPAWVMPEDVPVNLLADGAAPPARLRGPLGFGLVLLTLAALTLGAWYPAWQLRGVNEALALRAETAMVRANAALARQNAARAVMADVAALDAFAQPSGLLAVVGGLAEGLPDQTSLLALSAEAGTVTLTGLAPTAASLIEQVSAVEGLGRPELTTPVDTLSDGRERVSLRMAYGATP